MVRFQGIGVGSAEGGRELVVGVGEVMAEGLGGEVETTDRRSCWYGGIGGGEKCG